VDKKNLVFFAIVFALGVVAAGIIGYLRESDSRQLESARNLAEQYRTAEQLARERIDALESDNSRLQKHLDDAGGISQRLTASVSANVSDTRAAIEIVKQVIVQVKALDDLIMRSRTGGDSGDGVVDMEDR
jgi:hypothetical protein